MQVRLANSLDIDGILKLQELNLYSRMREEERKRGFVTTPFTIDQIEEILSQKGLFVAIDNNKVIAYVFAGSWKYFEQWPIFPFMTLRFPDLSFMGKEITVDNSFQYGPVCIDIDFRGKEVLNLIFEEMRLKLLKQYPISITFINKVNEISLRAHQKLGWKIIDEFQFNNNIYQGLAFDMQNSVLVLE